MGGKANNKEGVGKCKGFWGLNSKSYKDETSTLYR